MSVKEKKSKLTNFMAYKAKIFQNPKQGVW